MRKKKKKNKVINMVFFSFPGFPESVRNALAVKAQFQALVITITFEKKINTLRAPKILNPVLNTNVYTND